MYAMYVHPEYRQFHSTGEIVGSIGGGGGGEEARRHRGRSYFVLFRTSYSVRRTDIHFNYGGIPDVSTQDVEEVPRYL